MARLAPVFKNRRAGQLPLSSLVNVATYEDQRWLAHFDELASYSYDDHIFAAERNRRSTVRVGVGTQTIYGLDRLGIVQDGFSAIGIGAGREA